MTNQPTTDGADHTLPVQHDTSSDVGQRLFSDLNDRFYPAAKQDDVNKLVHDGVLPHGSSIIDYDQVKSHLQQDQATLAGKTAEQPTGDARTALEKRVTDEKAALAPYESINKLGQVTKDGGYYQTAENLLGISDKGGHSQMQEKELKALTQILQDQTKEQNHGKLPDSLAQKDHLLKPENFDHVLEKLSPFGQRLAKAADQEAALLNQRGVAGKAVREDLKKVGIDIPMSDSADIKEIPGMTIMPAGTRLMPGDVVVTSRTSANPHGNSFVVTEDMMSASGKRSHIPNFSKADDERIFRHVDQ